MGHWPVVENTNQLMFVDAQACKIVVRTARQKAAKWMAVHTFQNARLMQPLTTQMQLQR